MNDEILARKRREYRKLLEYSADQIVAKLSGLNVRKISLIGSHARGKSDLFTDLDVLVIMETDRPFIERIAEIYSLLALPVDGDILCYTPQEFRRMKETPFPRKVLADEVVLYERRASRRREKMAGAGGAGPEVVK